MPPPPPLLLLSSALLPLCWPARGLGVLADCNADDDAERAETHVVDDESLPVAVVVVVERRTTDSTVSRFGDSRRVRRVTSTRCTRSPLFVTLSDVCSIIAFSTLIVSSTLIVEPATLGVNAELR